MIQGTVHRVFNATSNWLAFDQALEKNKSCWTKNQYPEEWSSKIVNQTLEKIISGGKDQLRTTPKEHQKSKTNLRKQIEETMRIASSFYNANIKIVPPHPEIIL